MIVDESTYLAHYGVKGMRWGIRKEYESKGRRKASKTDDAKSTSSVKQQNKKWSTKKKIKVGAAVAAGILLASGAWYAYNKLSDQATRDPEVKNRFKTFKDTLDLSDMSDKGYTFKVGQRFQRISTESFEDLTNAGRTYVSFKFSDNAIYKDRLGDTRRREYGGPVYVHTLKAKKDLRVASPKDFAKVCIEAAKSRGEETNNAKILMLGTRMMNTSEPDIQDLISRLKAKGFNGMVDTNDYGWTSAPLIIFNPGEVVDSKSRKLGLVERVANTMVLPNNLITSLIDLVKK